MGKAKINKSFAKDEEGELLISFYKKALGKIKTYRKTIIIFLSVVLICTLLMQFGFFSIAYKVYIGENYIGCIGGRNTFENIIEEAVKTKGVSKKEYSLYPAIILGESYTERSKLLQGYFSVCENIREGVVFKIGDKERFAMENTGEMFALLNEFKKRYSDDKTEKSEFGEEVSIQQGFFGNELFLEKEKIIDILQKEVEVISFQSDGSRLINGENPDAWCVPVIAPLSSPFGERWGRVHQGIDIAALHGDEVKAAKEGVVLLSENSGGYGNLVIIDHGEGVKTYYAHLSKSLVKSGDTVSKGQVIALVGNTGNSTGPHLHFEVRINDIPQNPLEFIGF